MERRSNTQRATTYYFFLTVTALANKPVINFRKGWSPQRSANQSVIWLESLEKPKRTCQREDLENRVYASFEARKNASDRAKNLESSLEPEFPSFVKEMTQSHVTGGFWLGLSDGDALVFHLIKPTKFKVYIIRAYDRANSDSGSIGKENYVEVNKKPDENVSEATKLRGSSKRKRRQVEFEGRTS